MKMKAIFTDLHYCNTRTAMSCKQNYTPIRIPITKIPKYSHG